MTTIRFIREDLEIQCNPGENLRELVMRENLQLYGLKGILGNCGGAGQCSTCFISVEGGNKNSLSPLTSVEEEKLKNRPENWRLACQTLIKSSAVILTKPHYLVKLFKTVNQFIKFVYFSTLFQVMRL